MDIPRLRMFAGPNGSGKSTIKDIVQSINPAWLATYINPDEIEKSIASSGSIDFGTFKVKTDREEILTVLKNSTLLKNKAMTGEVARLEFAKNILSFTNVNINSYCVSAIADFLHEKLTASRRSFSFETVMSHPKKIEILQKALANKFRTYLYYVATDDPETNISRVQTRVIKGGHDVPHQKIVERYYRSLENLPGAIRNTSRAFIYDNTGAYVILLAEITDGKEIEIRHSDRKSVV